MIDWITIKYIIENFEVWRRSLDLSFTANVDTFNGLITAKRRNDTTIITHRGKWETFDLVVKEILQDSTGKQIFHLTVKGSLHKNHYNGANYLPFTWQQLQQQITHLCNTLSLNPSQAQISTLEVGVNIVTPFTVTPFILQNLINYKGKYLTRYPQDLGVTCRGTQYEVKIYDKGKQNELPHNLMRFELKYFKMQCLNGKGIKYLSDLQNFEKVNGLQPLLLNAWNNVLLFDILENVRNLPLKEHEINLLIEGQNPKFWEQLGITGTGEATTETKEELTKIEQNIQLEKIRYEYKYERDKFRKLVLKYGRKWTYLTLNLIKTEWQHLFKNYPNLPTVKNELLPILTIKIKGKNGEQSLIHNKRFCRACGNDITHQRKDSKSCSHHCRNSSSNPVNNFKRKIKTIQARGVLFDILPYFILPAQEPQVRTS